MKIELIKDAGGTVVLGDDAAAFPIQSLKGRIGGQWQPIEAIDAAGADQEYRGNQQTSLVVVARKGYASLAAAAAAWMDGMDTTAAKGTIKLTQDGTVRYVLSAGVRSSAPSQVGVSVYYTWQINGGAWSESAPS